VSAAGGHRLVTLDADSLWQIAARGIPVPPYDRSALRPRVLHLGVGGFHRAHLALYTDEVALAGGDWGIRGLGILPGDRRMAAVLGAQDCLYTLIERGNEPPLPRVIGSIVDYVLAVDDPAAVAARIADPGVAILSMTVTESGYSLEGPNATFDLIAGGLDRRRRERGGPLTIMSCDNLPGNGAAARAATMAACDARGDGLARWVEASCAFPSSMVDRITPVTTDGDREWLRTTWGVADAWPVVCERFRQWVVEDAFAAGRPTWEDAGAIVTDRVHEWELYKLRMLNAAHSCMAYLSALAGIAFVDEAVAEPAVRGFLERLLWREAIPTLAEIPGYPREDYAATVLERFANTGVRDQIARICIDGTAKFRSFLIPTVERQVAAGGPVDCAALALAGWARYLATTPRERRAPDASGDRSAADAARAAGDPASFVESNAIFTEPLRRSAPFRQAFVRASERLRALGPLAAMEQTSALEPAPTVP
jgi:mannitol 2-dehydrogenase